MSASFLFTCREAARVCPDVLIKKLLKDKTDDLHSALKLLAAVPTPDTMRTVVALWTHATKLLEKTTPVPPVTPLAGAGELERVAA